MADELYVDDFKSLAACFLDVWIHCMYLACHVHEVSEIPMEGEMMMSIWNELGWRPTSVH